MDENILKSTQLKTTKRRIAILSIIDKSEVPLTAEEIHSEVLNSININLSTIYRALSTLSEKGILLKNLSQDGKIYYQLNNHMHKHQLVCNICNKTVAIDACPLKKLEDYLSKQTGFTITGHSLQFSGICPTCSTQIK